MSNVMAALPNIDGALCSTPQSSLTPTILECRAVTLSRRSPLKLSGVLQTNETISAGSRPKFTIS